MSPVGQPAHPPWQSHGRCGSEMNLIERLEPEVAPGAVESDSHRAASRRFGAILGEQSRNRHAATAERAGDFSAHGTVI
jgi:hypothetical protein